MKHPDQRYLTKGLVKDLKRWAVTEGSSARAQSVIEMACHGNGYPE